jgi:uncharacterized coiled-coil protein SlyX
MTETPSPSHDRYAHLRAHAARQKQATLDRLNQAITQLEQEKRPVTTFTIKEVSGLDYMAYYRNAEALTLFRRHSTHLRKEREKEQAKRRRSKRQHAEQDVGLHEAAVASRDPFLNYKKPRLVAALRTARAERNQMEQQYQALLQEHMGCGLTIARLEAQLAEHLAFMERFRSSLRKEEYEP